jgi:hypothetical protein
MKPSEKNKLTRKFWNGETTTSQDELLFGNRNQYELNDDDKAYFRFIDEARKTTYNRENEIWQSIVARERRKMRYVYLSTAVAASFILLVSLSMLILHDVNDKDSNNQLTYNNTALYFKTLEFTNGSNPTLYINGCKTSTDLHTAMQVINPKCIQYINMVTEPEFSELSGNKNGIVEVWLKGKTDELFSVCEGTLYFYQDGEIQTIAIEDDCSPNLLVDCHEIPLSEIAQLKPHQIKSIELTNDPRNCNGQLDGEFIVLESK